MRFLVMGTGGVGGFFGAKLAKSGADVRFLARGKHFEAMHAGGLHIKSPDGDCTISSDKIISRIEDADKADVVFFCVKSYDTLPAANQLSPALHKDSIIISFQNGLDNEEAISSVVKTGSVMGGTAYISAIITAPGEITKYPGAQRLIFGPLDGNIAGVHQLILDSMVNAGIDATLSPAIASELWKKFIFLTPIAGFTAVTRLTLGEISSGEQTVTLFRKAMKEIEALAVSSGVSVPEGFIDSVIEKLPVQYAKTRSSLYFDLISGNRLEIDALFGTVIRIGRKLGIPTPVNEFLYAMLLPHHVNALHAREIRH